MIARRLAPCVATAVQHTRSEAEQRACRFAFSFVLSSPISMFDLLFFHLLWVFALLAVVLAVCCVVNWLWPDESLDGSRIFMTVALFALIFDAALTFLVFADSQLRYGKFSSALAFGGRACTYGLAGAAGFCFARLREQRRSRRFQALRINAAP